MFKENRWFTKLGRAKRVPAELEPFRQFVTNSKFHFIHGDAILLTRNIRLEWPQLSLSEAANLMVYLVGCYSNATQYGHGHVNGPLFRIERYLAGEIVAKSLSNKSFDIRTLELVK